MLLVVGILVVVWVFYAVVCGGLCVDDGRYPDSVEHAHLRRVAEARVAAVCPGAIRLAEKERAGGGAARGGSASAHEFWRRFAGASALVEEDPAAALEELRGLPELLEEALGGVEREVGTAEGLPEKEVGR